jgi:hypothetical protein
VETQVRQTYKNMPENVSQVLHLFRDHTSVVLHFCLG